MHALLVPVRGNFNEISGEATVSPSGEVSGKVVVGSASIDTRNQARDTHLKSADFFDSTNYPDIVFTVDNLVLSDGGASVTGSLQVRERVNKITTPVSISRQGDGSVELGTEVVIDRSDFGLTWNRMGMASMKNTITVHAVFARR